MSKNIFKSPFEWFLQAEYDFDTAKAMLDSGRYIYAIFMAHLALEKSLKGVYAFALKTEPPRTHNLLLLQERINAVMNLNLTDNQNELIEFLNEKSVLSRYPDTLKDVLKEFKKE